MVQLERLSLQVSTIKSICTVIFRVIFKTRLIQDTVNRLWRNSRVELIEEGWGPNPGKQPLRASIASQRASVHDVDEDDDDSYDSEFFEFVS